MANEFTRRSPALLLLGTLLVPLPGQAQPGAVQSQASSTACDGGDCDAFVVKDARNRAITLERIIVANPMGVATAIAIDSGVTRNEFVSKAGQRNPATAGAYYDAAFQLSRDIVPLMNKGTAADTQGATTKAVFAEASALQKIPMQAFDMPLSPSVDPVSTRRTLFVSAAFDFVTSPPLQRLIDIVGFKTKAQMAEVTLNTMLTEARVPAGKRPEAEAAVRPYAESFAETNGFEVMTRVLQDGVASHRLMVREMFDSKQASGALLMGMARAVSVAEPSTRQSGETASPANSFRCEIQTPLSRAGSAPGRRPG